MIGNPYPQFQNVQQWNDFVNEVRNALSTMNKTITTLYEDIDAGGEYVVPDATSTKKGIMKLYPSAGNNTDGTITQRALTVSQQEQDARISGIYATKEELASYPTKTEMADAIDALDAEVVKSVSVAKDTTAATGYAASYTISVNGTALDTKINIPIEDGSMNIGIVVSRTEPEKTNVVWVKPTD